MGDHGKGVIALSLLKYRFKSILRTKGIFLRCIIFPIIIATLCYTSFERAQYGTVSEGDKISVGVVAGLGKDIFDEQRFDVYSITETVAEKYLEDGVISSYIRVRETPELITIKYEDEQKITKAYLDAYLAGAPLAKLKGQHMTQELENTKRSVLLSNFAKLAMAAICTAIAAVLLLIVLGRNNREISLRSRMAAVSGFRMGLQDVIVVVSLLIVIFVILYGYIYFILRV